MKKVALITVLIGLLTVGCKKENKNQTNTITKEAQEVVVEPTLEIISDSTKINWTAYKTTDKVAVGGTFNKLELITQNKGKGTTPKDILDNASFSIPVNSVFTNNEDRDTKLKNIFFAALENTIVISGTIEVVDNKYVATISLNNVTKKINLTSNYTNNKLTLNGTINLEDFNASSAIKAINNACLDLHKGADGISKTWPDVAIIASVVFK